MLQTQVAFMYLAYVTWGVVGFCGAAVMLIHYIGVLAALAGKGAHSTPDEPETCWMQIFYYYCMNIFILQDAGGASQVLASTS